MLIHVVLFWLNDDTPDPVRQELLNDSEEMLAEAKTVRHVWSGRPAMTPRDVVDNSYDVGLCVCFDDKAGLDAYQIDPAHQAFLAKHKARWKKVLIYDFHRGAAKPT